MHLIYKRTLFLLAILALIGCADNKNPKQKALDLVLESRTINSEMTVRDYIDKYREEMGDEIKSLGWSVEEIANQKYLVVYNYKIFSFDRGTGEMGFYFEVDLKNNSVKNVTDEHQKELPLSNAYTDEKEIVDDLIDDIDSLTNR